MNSKMNSFSVSLAVLLALAHCCFYSKATVSRYCILPDALANVTLMSPNNTDCHIVTLAQLVTNTSSYIQSNTTIVFLFGQYLMPRSSILHITNVQGLVLSGNEHADRSNTQPPEISCQNSDSGFLFTDIINLTVSNLRISNCGRLMSFEPPTLSRNQYQQTATLFLASITNLSLRQVEISNGLGYGLYGVNIIGSSSMEDSHFVNNTRGGNVLLQYVDLNFREFCMKMHHLLISSSSFRLGESILRLAPPVSNIGAGLSVKLQQASFAINITILQTNASGNTARRAPNFQFDSISSAPNIVTLKECIANDGTVLFGGASGFQYSHFHLLPSFLPPCENTAIPSQTVISLADSKFVNSKGKEDPGFFNEYVSNAITTIFFISRSGYLPHSISVRNCDISNNTGGSGVGLFSQIVGEVSTEGSVKFEVVNSTFRNNTSTSFRTNLLSVLYFTNMDDVRIENVTVTTNIGTGILLSNRSNVYFNGVNRIENNSAYNGGGLALHGDSFIYLKPYTHILFISNTAENVGGGIYFAKTTDTIIRPQCFFQFYDSPKGVDPRLLPEFSFVNNTAELAGNDLYGGSLETCLTKQSIQGSQIFPLLTGQFRHGRVPDVSSKPVRVCLCNSTTEEPNCPHFIHSISVYPGSTFSLPAIAVGQMFYYSPSGTPSAIYASLLPKGQTKGSIPDEMTTQGSERYCSPLTYRIDSINSYETMVLTVEKSHEVKQRDQNLISKAKFWFRSNREVLTIFIEIPVYVNVTLLPCPLGFELSTQGTCSCASFFLDQAISCSIDTNTLHRVPPMWVGTKFVTNSSDSNESAPVYMTHNNCPYDYCITGSIDVYLGDSDVQCAFNRSGTLCGACKDGLSAVLGGSQCMRCSNLYLLLLIPFALAGALLIVFLLGTNMTVTIGTINGLLFYANIIRENQSTFFPSNTDPNVLTVFIAWLNLDLGITTCFYDGMDTYAKAWMQFLFPVYIWLLTAIIIILCNHLTFFAKLCGKNIVPVLATLFLLSYTKLQRAIFTGISFTVVQQSNNSTEFVWLADPTLAYLQGKHIYLFIISTIFFLFFFLPYTLAILFGPFLLAKSSYNLCSCIQRLKPMFDAYFGPYKDKYRYWTGALLLTRMLQVVLSAANVFGNPSINLLASSIVSYILIIFVWQSGGVYKNWILSCLESFFFLNIGLLSTVTLYIRLSGGNQYAATYLSAGIAFAVFLALLTYHILVYTPIKISERSCVVHIKTSLSKVSIWKRLKNVFAKEDPTTVCSTSHFNDFELPDRLIEADSEGRGESVSVCKDSERLEHPEHPENKRVVTSMHIAFNDLREPVYEFGTLKE